MRFLCSSERMQTQQQMWPAHRTSANAHLNKASVLSLILIRLHAHVYAQGQMPETQVVCVPGVRPWAHTALNIRTPRYPMQLPFQQPVKLFERLTAAFAHSYCKRQSPLHGA